MAFHTHSNWFFERLEDGSVRITSRAPNETPVEEWVVICEHILDKHVWASVVSSMSAKGEENGRYYQALDFHEGK